MSVCDCSAAIVPTTHTRTLDKLVKEEHPSVSGVIDFTETFEQTATSDEWETRTITGHYNNFALERHEQRTGHLTSRMVDSEDVRVDWVEDDDYDYWYWMRETDETVAHRPAGGELTGQTDVGFWSDNSNIDEALTWPVDPNDDPLPLDTAHAIDPPPGEMFPGGAAVPGPAESKEGGERSFGKLFVDAAAHAWDTTVYFGGNYVDYLGIELATAGTTIVDTGWAMGDFVGDHASMAYYDPERELGRVKDGAISTWQGLSTLVSQISNDPWGTLSGIGSATANYLDRLTRDPEVAGQLLGHSATAWTSGGVAQAGKQAVQNTLSTLWKLGREADRLTPGAGFAAPAQVQINKEIGDAASDAIAKRFPGARREVILQTSDGARRIDVLTETGTAIESKVGRTSLTKEIRRQVLKDAELLRDPTSGVNEVAWEFSTSPTTGKGGPTASLRKLLDENGIGVQINPWLRSTRFLTPR